MATPPFPRRFSPYPTTQAMYRREICLTDATAPAIFKASSFLLIDPVVKACAHFLGRRLTHENCMQTLDLAQRLAHQGLRRSTQAFICEQFTALARDGALLELDADTLLPMLQDDALQVVACTLANGGVDVRMRLEDARVRLGVVVGQRRCVGWRGG